MFCEKERESVCWSLLMNYISKFPTFLLALCEFMSFISELGYLTGSENYFTHIRANGLDFHTEDDKGLVNEWGYDNQYSAHVFARKAENLIDSHDTSKVICGVIF